MRGRPCRWRWWRRAEGRPRDGRPTPGLGPGSGHGVDVAGQAALVPRRGVVVDDALLGRLVDLADRLVQGLLGLAGVTLGDGGAKLLHVGLELRQVRAVALVALDARPLLLQCGCVMSQSKLLLQLTAKA